MGRFANPNLLAATSVAGKPDQKNQKRSSQSCGINTRQSAHLSTPDGGSSELAFFASMLSALCIALRILATLCQPALIVAEENTRCLNAEESAVFNDSSSWIHCNTLKHAATRYDTVKHSETK